MSCLHSQDSVYWLHSFICLSAQVPSACSIAAISHSVLTSHWTWWPDTTFRIVHLLDISFHLFFLSCFGSLWEFCYFLFSLSIHIFPHSSFFYPEGGAVIFFNTVTVYGIAWCHTPEDTFLQLTAHNAIWLYSRWYMCPIFGSLITAPLSHGEPASVRTLLYSCCAETPWKGHCALLLLKKHARRCLCICGRSVSKRGWEETVKMPWCTDNFLCSSNFACIVMGTSLSTTLSWSHIVWC
jgi:hypothetical protein